MKKSIFILLLALTVFSCSKEEEIVMQEALQDATLVGRWNVEGFEGAVLYEFTETQRFTMYSGDGEFETLEEVIASGRHGNDWTREGDEVTIDLHFGNFSTKTIQFVCDNQVINWLNNDGEIESTLYREGFDYASCNQ